MIKTKSKISLIFFLIIIAICPFLFSACASTDTKHNDTKLSISTNYTCDYRVATDETKVSFNLVMDNNTIYNMKAQSLTFDLYKDGAFVKSETFDYVFFVLNSASGVNKSAYFITSGEVDEIKSFTFDCLYYNFWETYKLYIILTIIISVILAVVYIILMCVFDWDFDDILEDAWLLVFALVFFVPYIVSGFITGSWGWVAPLIILGGIVFAVGVASIAQAIKEAV